MTIYLATVARLYLLCSVTISVCSAVVTPILYLERPLLWLNVSTFGGLWYLPPHSTIFQLCCTRQFYWWRKHWVPTENHWHAQVTYKRYLIMSYRVYLAMSGIWTSNFIGDSHWQYRKLYIKLSYHQDHD